MAGDGGMPAPMAMSGPRAFVPELFAGDLAVRAVRRAAADLRMGLPVVLTGPVPMVTICAETADEPGLAAMRALAGGPSRLLLSRVRAAAVAGDGWRDPEATAGDPAAPAALWLPDALMAPGWLRRLADPTLPRVPRAGLRPADAVAEMDAGALALAKLARLLPASVIAPAVTGWAAVAQALGVLSVAATAVGGPRRDGAPDLRKIAEARVPLEDAPDCRVLVFRDSRTGQDHLAIVIGRPETREAPLVRLHSECMTGDLLGSMRCDCGPQLRRAIRRMAEDGAGVVVYLAQEGRGIGLANKLRAYALQDAGLDTLDANLALGWGGDERDYGVAAAMLRLLGQRRVRLLTNNPAKVAALSAAGVAVERAAHGVRPNGVNDGYLATKVARFGHFSV